MNKEELLNAANVMKAAAEGKAVEYKRRDPSLSHWSSASIPIWDWAAYEYRIRKEPKMLYVVADGNGARAGLYDNPSKAEDYLITCQLKGLLGPYTLEIYRQI